MGPCLSRRWHEDVADRLSDVEARLLALDARLAELRLHVRRAERSRTVRRSEESTSDAKTSSDNCNDESGDENAANAPASSDNRNHESGDEDAREVRNSPRSRPRRRVVARERVAELEAMHLEDLKALLIINKQRSTGPKREVIARIVECLEYGCLPRCLKCRRSTLIPCGAGFRSPTGIIWGAGLRCPGYVLGTGFHVCDFVCSEDALTSFPAFVWK